MKSAQSYTFPHVLPPIIEKSLAYRNKRFNGKVVKMIQQNVAFLMVKEDEESSIKKNSYT